MPDRKSEYIRGDRVLESVAGPAYAQLSEMRDIEYTGPRSDRTVFGNHSFVLERHLPTGEVDGSSTQSFVQVQKWRLPARNAHGNAPL
jgi:hypothetical protein